MRLAFDRNVEGMNVMESIPCIRVSHPVRRRRTRVVSELIDRIASHRIAQSRTYRVAKLGGEPIGELLDARGDFIKRHGLFSAISFNDVHRARVYEYRVRRRANKNGDV